MEALEKKQEGTPKANVATDSGGRKKKTGWNSLNVARREASDRNVWKANVYPLSYVPSCMERVKVKVRYIWKK